VRPEPDLSGIGEHSEYLSRRNPLCDEDFDLTDLAEYTHEEYDDSEQSPLQIIGKTIFLGSAVLAVVVIGGMKYLTDFKDLMPFTSILPASVEERTYTTTSSDGAIRMVSVGTVDEIEHKASEQTVNAAFDSVLPIDGNSSEVAESTEVAESVNAIDQSVVDDLINDGAIRMVSVDSTVDTERETSEVETASSVTRNFSVLYR